MAASAAPTFFIKAIRQIRISFRVNHNQRVSGANNLHDNRLDVPGFANAGGAKNATVLIHRFKLSKDHFLLFQPKAERSRITVVGGRFRDFG